MSNHILLSLGERDKEVVIRPFTHHNDMERSKTKVMLQSAFICQHEAQLKINIATFNMFIKL